MVWNLTLAANIISANVEYGQIEKIEKISGVEAVLIETRYEPCVVKDNETTDPNMATSGSMIGSHVAWRTVIPAPAPRWPSSIPVLTPTIPLWIPMPSPMP